MKKLILSISIFLSAVATAKAQQYTVSSPDNKLNVSINVAEGKMNYAVSLDGKQMIEPSQLGFVTNKSDWSKGLSVKNTSTEQVMKCYEMRNAKASHINYEANKLVVSLETADNYKYDVEFQVSDNNVAFRYIIPQQKDDVRSLIITKELSSFKLPDNTTTFITPQSDPMVGWMHTKPSYEEEYTRDAPVAQHSAFGHGFTFPCLFHEGEDGWVLIAETGVNGTYCGSHLSDWDAKNGYSIAFPMDGEMNGLGNATPGLSLPQPTPWRTITLGKTLKPITETTIQYDVVDEVYEASTNYKNGRYTWSWLIWQDDKVTYDVQKQMIDLSAAMGYEYVLVDGWWDVQIGRDKIAELSKYAQSKGVSLMLWYNSNGHWSDAPQTPRNGMNTAVNRHREMKWMKSIGIKGIKVDFFPGDKQPTMQLYEDILADANEYGIQVIFHGCTIPRGWERMYPNFIASEAVLASENVFFNEGAAKREPFDLTLHPFCRNASASMDWGGVIMNKFMSEDNKSRHPRHTTDLFEMASGITMQTAVQCVAIYPNNLQDVDQDKMEWLKTLPCKWEETLFVDGYPGKYAVIARKSNGKWYIGALNGTKENMTLNLDLSFIGNKQTVTLHDDWKMNQTVKTDKNGKLKIKIKAEGGAIISTL